MLSNSGTASTNSSSRSTRSARLYEGVVTKTCRLSSPLPRQGHSRRGAWTPLHGKQEKQRLNRASQASCIMISDRSTSNRGPCRQSTTGSARGCKPCLRYDPSPVSQSRTRRIMAEREGFEPSERSRAQRFSRPPRSTTPAPLRLGVAAIARRWVVRWALYGIGLIGPQHLVLNCRQP